MSELKAADIQDLHERMDCDRRTSMTLDECASGMRSGILSDEAPPLTLEHLRRVQLEPGDVLVLHHGCHLPRAERERQAAVLEHTFKGHKYLIVEDGATLGIVGGQSPEFSIGEGI